VTRLASRLWARLTLVSRLALVVAVTTILLAAVAVYPSARFFAHDARDEMAGEYNEEMGTLESMVLYNAFSEPGTDGQVAIQRLTAILNQFSYSTDVAQVSFRDTADAIAFKKDIEVPLTAPGFFSHLCGVETLSGSRPIVLDGQYVGLVTLSISPRRIINLAWQQYQFLAWVMLAAAAINLMWIWFVLRGSLRPLVSLAEAGRRLTQGDYSVRVGLRGSPEVRSALSSFNQMAANFETTLSELRQSEAKSRNLFDKASIGHSITAIDGHIRVNRSFCDMLGYSMEELEQSSWQSLTHPDDRELTEKALQELQDDERQSARLVKRYLRKDGSIVWADVNTVLQRGTGGEPEYFITGVVDITDRVEAEEALQRSAEELRQSQKMEAVGQLAGGIAHDFNNLLNVILGYTDLALAGDAANLDDVREDLAEIKRAGERASALTKQILAFSRRQTLRPQRASINDILDGTEALLRRTLGENIELRRVREPELGKVEVDVHQFEQVIMNLALNARDAMVSGGHLTLETANVELDEEYSSAHPEVSPGSYVMLAVSDTGVGMNEATRERIFEPFFTTKGPGAGTGLGLATVYGIVKQSGGGISVSSEVGKGTTFKIYLPRVAAGLQDEAAPASGATVMGGRETILVVEDEVSLRRLVARILENLGYRALAAGTGAEALETLAASGGSVDLLLTDVVLPGAMQGNDVAEALLSSRPDLPVLYMSGYARKAIVHAGRLDEGINLLEKPFTPEALATMVRAVLDRARESG
jgi:two-component system, cell cycle sensor histidine kinase and response regulator CckA